MGRGRVNEAAVHEVLANLYFLLVNYGLWSDICTALAHATSCRRTVTTRRDGHVFIATLMPGLWDKPVTVVGDPRLTEAALQDPDYRNEHPNWWIRFSGSSPRALSAGR